MLGTEPTAATGHIQKWVGGELKTQNSKLKTLVGASIALFVFVAGCGKEGMPLPPEIKVAERTTDLTAFQEGGVAVLEWSYPSMTTDGGALTDLEVIQIWRASLPKGQEPPPPVSSQDRQMRRQLLETQGEVIPTLEPEALAEITRGSSLVFRDDLSAWRASAADAEETIIWYGVRTVCCKRRESALSNIVRLLPQLPPDPPAGLQLQAGLDGISLEWTAAGDALVLVERSPDGARWTRVTEEPISETGWLDSEAAQGQSWSYRLRAVSRVEGGGRVIGEPSPPARIDHPDTYPPAKPEGVVCLPEGQRVRVRWQPVAGAAVYELTRQRGETRTEVLAGDHSSVEFTDPKPPLGEITYLVVARDAAGNRSEAASCTVVMGAAP